MSMKQENTLFILSWDILWKVKKRSLDYGSMRQKVNINGCRFSTKSKLEVLRTFSSFQWTVSVDLKKVHMPFFLMLLCNDVLFILYVIQLNTFRVKIIKHLQKL